MKKTIIYGLSLIFFVFSCSAIHAAEPKTITFPSKDGLKITADIYIKHDAKDTPFIVLFHQAGWSRGEYLEIAPKLNQLGFNCMAVDLRSGKEVNGVINKTVLLAKAKKLGTTYIDAFPDIEASLEYARKNYGNGKIIAWGSSYSASLALKIAGDNPGLVDGILAFSPGEYFTGMKKPNDWIRASAMNINVPVFITSAKSERESWISIFKAIPSKNKVSYVPHSLGNHGSRALWERYRDSKDYWEAVDKFLKKYFKN